VMTSEFTCLNTFIFHFEFVVTADIKPRLLSSTKKARHVAFTKTTSLGQEKVHVHLIETGKNNVKAQYLYN